MNIILVKGSFLNMFESADLCKDQQQYLRTLFLFPKDLNCIHAPFDPNNEIARFISKNFRVVDGADGYSILQLAR